jgi:hypothetical protein
MSSRKIFNYESKVLVEKTVREEGYHPDQFGPSSAKFIWAICRYCGEPSRIRKGFFTKRAQLAIRHARLKSRSWHRRSKTRRHEKKQNRLF